MRGYLGHTRPDTGFATSHCAFYAQHKAVARKEYLKLTQDKGLILCPTICEIIL
jgi:hypothetical protein